MQIQDIASRLVRSFNRYSDYVREHTRGLNANTVDVIDGDARETRDLLEELCASIEQLTANQKRTAEPAIA